MEPLPDACMPVPDLLLESEGSVRSRQFDDVYFSRAGGAAETRHVFLKGNGLPERFNAQAHFTIGELGFGTGLNFLTAWQDFLAATGEAQHLHYISVEKYPLTVTQLRAVYGDDAWIDSYPMRLPGWHRIHLERCTLTLGFGEAETLLAGMEARIDAWFLDGFAPAKNPDMWQTSLLRHVARLSAAEATFATFTAAGAVKRALQSHGFTVEKIKGYGYKRDMLAGWRTGLTVAVRPRPVGVLVIGAGIAGCVLARTLAERGVAVTVVEADDVAGGASGNAAAALYPQLTKFYTPATAWHAIAYDFTLRQLRRWQAAGLPFTCKPLGLVRVPREGTAAALLDTLRMDPSIAHAVAREEASAMVGTPMVAGGISLPQASWLNPVELCHALLQHARITLEKPCKITALAEKDGRWQATGDRSFSAEAVCLCVAHGATALLPAYAMPIAISAGQVTMVADSAPGLNRMISYRGYVIPTPQGHIIGATYDHHDFSCAVTARNHAENLRHARAALPTWQPGAVVGGRTSLRATTPDRLPYVGAVAAGLYVSIGHGSRGMISAPLAAEIIAAQIMGEMVPLTPELRAAVNPLRRAAASV